MLFKIIAFVFYLVLLSPYAHAATTYDFSTRDPGNNAIAYDGISSTVLPPNNSFPSNQHSTSEYTNISADDGLVTTTSTSQNNNYPMLRYVFDLDEAETDIDQLSFFWKGSGTNDNNGRDDGIVLYLWNYSNGNYEQIATSGNTPSEVNLTHAITVNIIDYIDESNNNKLILLVVSNDKANGNKNNEIRADYVKIEVESTSQPDILAEYRFEESSWNGTAGEILDSTGNGYHAQVLSNSIPESALPVLSGNPGTCNYASQNNGAINVIGLPLDTSTNSIKTTVTFWMNWDGTNNAMPIGWDTHDIWLYNGSIGFNTGNGDIYGISSAGLANGWHHITVEFTNGSVTSNRMYVDGVEQTLTQRRNSPNDSKAFVDSELRIGGWSRDNGYRFHGLMDEIRIYQGTLTTPQVNTIMAERHPCAFSPLAEYRLDELNWDSTPNEVSDNSGNNHHGVAIGMTTLPAGKICSAGDFSKTGTSDYLSLANTAANNLTDFTVSVWATKNFTQTGTILSGANAVQQNEMIMFFPGNNTFRPYIKAGNVSLSNGGIGDGNWHHLVWTRKGNSQCYYVDGTEIQCGNISRSGALRIDPTGLIIGQEQDSLGGRFDPNQAWNGLLDELLIFDSALLESDIQTIFTNQNAGNNYDGSSRACPTPAIPLLEFRFEEESWDGSAGEILDNTGNGHNAQVNNNSIPETTLPALSGNPGTCGYANQNDGSIQVTGLPIDTSTIGIKTTVTFWMNWDGTDNVMPIGWNLHDIWIRNGSIGFNTFNSDIYGVSSAGLANGWHHIAVEFTNGSVTNNRMHIDGVEQVLTQRRGSPNNARAFVNSQMRVGGVSNSTGYDFHGLLDEFKVYESALTTGQVLEIMAERHECNSSIIHHYEISHDGQGLTCDSETVTIKACTNATCSTLSTESVTLDFMGNGTLISTETFTDSIDIDFNNTDVETLSLSIENATVIATDPIVCDDSSGASCDMVFTDAGFRFLYGASDPLTSDDINNPKDIPNQTSGSVFADTLKIQAVKDVNGVCIGLFTNNVDVDLWQENVDPGGTSGLSFSIAGNDIAKQVGALPLTTLAFGANSIATIATPLYNDAGQIRLRANYEVAGVKLLGSSNAFWVSPAELAVSATFIDISLGTVNLDSATAIAEPAYAAGESFTLTVAAYNNLGVITPNYSPGQIQFMLARTGPILAGSVDGDLAYAAAETPLTTSTSPIFQSIVLNSFSLGESIYNAANYSEVGLLNLDIQDNNYGNAGIVVPATAINIGRFTPEHFQQTVVDDGYFSATCNKGVPLDDFAYSGQKDEVTDSIGAIAYFTNPILKITAHNKQGDITENYYEDSQASVNDYMKLSNTDINLTAPTVDQAAMGVDGNPLNRLTLTANMNTGILSQNDLTALPNIVALPKGVLHYQLSDDDNFFYNRSANALVKPFTSDIKFSIATIIDGDKIDLIPSLGLPITADASPDGVEIRFGRLLLQNSFGPETSNLPQQMQIEHFDGTTFIVSTDNNCVSYDASRVSLTNTNNSNSLDPALTDVLGGIGSFVAGKTQAIELKAPGAENQGQIDVSYDIYDWLKYDWDNDGAFDDNPSATATFGIFRGNDRIIYSREVSE